MVVAYGLILPPALLALPRLGASTSMPRCCRAGAARPRSSAPSWPAMRRPASPSCRWSPGLDTGAMLAQQRVPIDAAANVAAAARPALRSWVPTLLLETLQRLEAGHAAPQGATDAGRDLRRQDRQGRGADRLAAQRAGRSTARCGPSIPGRWPRRCGTVSSCASGRRSAGRGDAALPARTRILRSPGSILRSGARAAAGAVRPGRARG